MKRPAKNDFISFLTPLSYDEAIRAVICMTPMLGSMYIGDYTYLSALGQGGFYYSYLPLPEKIGARVLNMFLLLSLGLGFYLIGGNVVPYKGLAIFFTFIVGIMLVLLSGWKVLGPLAFSFISLYAAGLNASSPERASGSFLAFTIAISWAGFISLLPIWKGSPKKKHVEVDEVRLYETSFRMGLGTSIALAISYFFEFSKLGWAVSGVGNVIRFDDTSKMRARLRMLGTFLGVVLVGITFSLTSSIPILIATSFLYAFLNGLFKKSKLGMLVIFYTAMILTLYSLEDISMIQELNLTRFMYNLVGVSIGLLLVYYPFPKIYPKIHRYLKEQQLIQKADGL